MSSYQERIRGLSEEIRSASGEVGLAKNTSNLFRDRNETGKKKLDVRNFNHVLSVNPKEGWVEAEGMTTYEELVRETLAHGVMPAVVPQLKSITIGGAVSGVGIEASSFKHGLVHETMLEADVLLADGRIVTATPANEHADLFHGLANSYGTLGYILRVKAKTIPVKKFVKLSYEKFSDPREFFAAVEKACASDANFVDGVVFNHTHMTLITSRFVEEAPYAGDYTFMKVFYESIKARSEDFLKTEDFIWRWDTDWFWCSKNMGMRNPLLRFLMGRKRLNSITYAKIMRFATKWKITERLDRFTRGGSESVIQDICIPIRNAEKFLQFLLNDIGILPIWICPTRSPRPGAFPLFPVKDELEIDFGFWDFVKTPEKFEDGRFNRLVEARTIELDGLKSLYSRSFFDRETFWTIYGKKAYDDVKRRYDPTHRFKDLYEKCVLSR